MAPQNSPNMAIDIGRPPSPSFMSMSLSSGSSSSGATTPCEIIDIRLTKTALSLRNEIAKSFLDPSPEDGNERSLPTMLLYDAEGLKLFEKITYLEEYYLTEAEISVLKRWSWSMAERIPDGAVLVELGSGNLRKVSILLQALADSGKYITYYALDLSLPELERTLSQIPDSLPRRQINCIGLHGTYDDGLHWLSTNPAVKDKKKCILWLGSSIGNFDRPDAIKFLKNIADKSLSAGDMMLVGIDGCKSPEKVWVAYNDPHGVTREFELNGLKHANHVLGDDVFKSGEWDYVGEWNETEGRHQAFFVAMKDLAIDSEKFGKEWGKGEVKIRKGERVRIERSYKFDEREVSETWAGAGLAEGARWGCCIGDYNLHLVYKPPFSFPLHPSEYAKYPQPTLEEWRELWKAWDTVTLKMIPQHHLLSKPIDLRNPCIFYIGHIPTFLDIHVSRATSSPGLAPGRYWSIFERGIDPDVKDPNQCHRHSEIPEEWPALEEILEFVKKLRRRIEILYGGEGGTDVAWGEKERDRKRLRRALWLAYEHEAMHLETLLYMLIQSPDTLPPPGVVPPDWEDQAERWRNVQLPCDEINPWVEIPEREITIGMDDPESDDDDDVVRDGGRRRFGWDNEKPKRTGVKVKRFWARAAPICVGEYVDYLIYKLIQTTSKEEVTTIDIEKLDIPASWILTPHAKTPPVATPPTSSDNLRQKVLSTFSIRTFYGPLSLQNPYALSLPLIASYDELSSCANFLGGRIPTKEEILSAYDYREEYLHSRRRKLGGDELVEKKDARMISAVNGQMNASGVTESPPHAPSSLSSSSTPYSHFSEEATGEDGAFIDLSPARGQVSFTGPWGFTPVRDPVQQLVTISSALGGLDAMRLLRGRGETGGAWEWTSTVLQEHEGFKEQREYREYTKDFFDGKHNVVLGGGWATVGRLAGRKSLVNWYQRNYRYTWCTARVVRDY